MRRLRIGDEPPGRLLGYGSDRAIEGARASHRGAGTQLRKRFAQATTMPAVRGTDYGVWRRMKLVR